MKDSDARAGNTENRDSDVDASAKRLSRDSFAGHSKSDLLNVDTRTPLDQFVGGLYDGAIAKPIQAVKQITSGRTDPESSRVAESSGQPSTHAITKESGYSTAGQSVGSLVPFVALATVTKGAGNQIFGNLEQQTLTRVVGEQAVAGFALGALLTPSELKPGESLLESRLKTGAKDATVFASMSLTNGLLSKVVPGALPSAEINNRVASLVARRMGTGAASGAVGGFLDAEIKTGGTASGTELLTSMAGYAAFGSLMEGGNVLAKRYLAGAPRTEPFNSGSESRNISDSTQPRSGDFQLTAARLATQDSNTVVIDSFGGWYDKLMKAVRTATPGQTIIVSEEAWLKEGQLMLRRANRTDVNLIMAKPVGDAAILPVQTAQATYDGNVHSKIMSSDTATVSSTFMDKRALAKAIEREVLKSGLEPGQALVEALKRNRVLMIGEYHTPDNPHRDLGAQLMATLKKNGATHLAIEHSATHKGKIFTPEGEIRTEQFTTFMNQWEYHRLLQNARKSGMQVVPVDSKESALAPILAKLEPELKSMDIPAQNAARTAATLTKRNVDMADNISSILANDPQAKVVFWVGNYHLNTTPMPGEGPQVAQILRDRKVPVATFASQHDGYWTSEPMRDIYTPPQAFAVPMKEAPVLGKQTMQNKNEAGADRLFFDQYDFLIMYPKKGYTYD